MMKIYICGPITGLPNFNKPAFHEALIRLNSSDQVRAVNPHTLCSQIVTNHKGTPEQLWQKCMKADIAEMLTCDGLALLPGWTNSRGAKIEYDLAVLLGIQSLPIDEWYKILGV